MTKEDEYYVGTCTHTNENNIEREESCPRRISWLRSMEKHGLRVKIALLDNNHAGFLYIMPIEINPWNIPCVPPFRHKKSPPGSFPEGLVSMNCKLSI